MSYRLRPGKSLEKETKRIALAHLEKAEAALRDRSGDRDEAVHDARKDFKKLRGLYRLVRAGAADFYQCENARLRDVARSLSGVRDATALVEAVDGLRRHIALEHAPEALAVVQANLAERRDRIARTGGLAESRMSEAADACRAARDAVVRLDLKGRSDLKIIAAGWQTICRQAGRAIEASATNAAAADFHDLRKRVKYHWMHARLARDAWPSAMKLRAREAEQLGDLLGDEHNLALLSDLAEAEPAVVGSQAEREILGRLVADRRAELRAEGLLRARRLFGEPAGESARRLALLWRSASD